MVSFVDTTETRTISSFITIVSPVPPSVSIIPPSNGNSPANPLISQSSQSNPFFSNPFAPSQTDTLNPTPSTSINPFESTSPTSISPSTIVPSPTSTRGTSTPLSTNNSTGNVTWPVIVGPLLGFGAIIIILLALYIWHRRRTHDIPNITPLATPVTPSTPSKWMNFKDKLTPWRRSPSIQELVPREDEKRPLHFGATPSLTQVWNDRRTGVPRQIPVRNRPDPMYEMALRQPNRGAGQDESTTFFNTATTAQRTDGGFEVRRNIRPSWYYLEGGWRR